MRGGQGLEKGCGDAEITTVCSIDSEVDVWEPSADLMYTIRGVAVPGFLDVKASLMYNTRIIKQISGFFMWLSYHYVIPFFYKNLQKGMVVVAK